MIPGWAGYQMYQRSLRPMLRPMPYHLPPRFLQPGYGTPGMGGMNPNFIQPVGDNPAARPNYPQVVSLTTGVPAAGFNNALAGQGVQSLGQGMWGIQPAPSLFGSPPPQPITDDLSGRPGKYGGGSKFV